MKPISKLAFSMLCTLAITAPVNAETAVFIPSSNVNYQEIIPGTVSFGTVEGARETGPHGTFVKIPPGKATPLHTHAGAYSAVIIQGIFRNPIPGVADSNQTLGAGSFYHVPAGAKHVTECAENSPVDCISYFYQAGAFDFEVAQ